MKVYQESALSFSTVKKWAIEFKCSPASGEKHQPPKKISRRYIKWSWTIEDQWCMRYLNLSACGRKGYISHKEFRMRGICAIFSQCLTHFLNISADLILLMNRESFITLHVYKTEIETISSGKKSLLVFWVNSREILLIDMIYEEWSNNKGNHEYLDKLDHYICTPDLSCKKKSSSIRMMCQPKMLLGQVWIWSLWLSCTS